MPLKLSSVSSKHVPACPGGCASVDRTHDLTIRRRSSMNPRQLDIVRSKLLSAWIEQQLRCLSSCKSGGPSANMPSQQPPTPPTSPTSESEIAMSSRASTTGPQTPPSLLKCKRDAEKATIPNDALVKEEQYFLDPQAMQRAADLLARDQWINDDCINQVLEVFNPDPTAWYVATTHLVSSGDHSETAMSKQKDFLSNPPRKLLLPLLNQLQKKASG